MTEPQTADPHPLVQRIERIRAERGPDQPSVEQPLCEQERYLWDADLGKIRRGMQNIPPRYADAIPTNPAVTLWAEQTIAGNGDGLLILGPVGTGKTWQAYGALRQIIAAGMGGSMRAGTAADLLESCRPGRTHTEPPSFRNDYTSREIDPVEQLQTVGVLLIDDIGAFKASDWTAEVLYRVIDARWAHRRPTIVTSNLTPADLTEVLGARLASRLAGCCCQVALKGADRRRVTA